MKIIYDHQIFNIQKYGGASRYFFELISRVCKAPEFTTSLFSGLNINRYGLDEYREFFKEHRGFTRPAIPKTNRFFGALNDALFNRAMAHWTGDIYHQTYYACLADRFRGKRVVTVFDMTHERYPGFFLERDRVVQQKKAALLKADGIICISESTRKDLQEYYAIHDEKIKVIHLGNSLRSYRSSSRIINKPYILFVGERRGYKNFIALLTTYANAVRVNKEFSLICFGGGPFSAQERSIISARRITDQVQWRSGSDEMLANLYTHAAVFVYPSLYEGFGIPLLEAAHFGCPILASGCSSFPEVAGTAALYFDPALRDDLAVKLETVLYDEPLRNELVRCGYEREKLFSWDKCAKETVQYYHQLAE